MPARISGHSQPWFTVSEGLSRAVTTTAIDVQDITAVAFDVDVEVTFGALSTAFELSAFQPIGVDDTVATITVDTAAFMFAMSK